MNFIKKPSFEVSRMIERIRRDVTNRDVNPLLLTADEAEMMEQALSFAAWYATATPEEQVAVYRAPFHTPRRKRIVRKVCANV